jgi:DNA helicase-2/ATP-dependent DNA helicase PcrA
VGKKTLGNIEAYAKERNLTMLDALGEMIQGTRMSAALKEFYADVCTWQETYQGRALLDVLQEVLEKSGYEEMLRMSGEDDRLDNIAELRQSIYEYQTDDEDATLHDYLQSVTLYAEAAEEESKEAVKLMTVHAAKGLEFPYVFLAQFNEGNFPSKKSRSEQEIEEERRVAYVALTRAERALFISENEGIRYGMNDNYPSRFLFDIPKEELNILVPLSEEYEMEAKSFARSQVGYRPKIETPDVLFNVGDRVENDYFGKGVIVMEREDKMMFRVKFDDLPQERFVLAKKLKLVEN